MTIVMNKKKWGVRKFGYEKYVVLDDIGAEVCYTHSAETGRLIAAAPDLLDALIALEKQALQSNANHPSNKWGLEALSDARAAIEKAKGKYNA